MVCLCLMFSSFNNLFAFSNIFIIFIFSDNLDVNF